MYFLVLPQQSSLLGLYGSILLHLLGNTGKYSPSCKTNTENQIFQYWPTSKNNTGSITFRNWECLYYGSSRDIRWNIAWGLGISLGLHPRDFPPAQPIFHRTSLLWGPLSCLAWPGNSRGAWAFFEAEKSEEGRRDASKEIDGWRGCCRSEEKCRKDVAKNKTKIR